MMQGLGKLALRRGDRRASIRRHLGPSGPFHPRQALACARRDRHVGPRRLGRDPGGWRACQRRVHRRAIGSDPTVLVVLRGRRQFDRAVPRDRSRPGQGTREARGQGLGPEGTVRWTCVRSPTGSNFRRGLWPCRTVMCSWWKCWLGDSPASPRTAASRWSQPPAAARTARRSVPTGAVGLPTMAGTDASRCTACCSRPMRHWIPRPEASRQSISTRVKSRRFIPPDPHGPLWGPNDLVFDAHGGFWFTDFGRNRDRARTRGAVYYALADGSRIEEAIYPLDSPNGIGLSPDGATALRRRHVSVPGARVQTFGAR